MSTDSRGSGDRPAVYTWDPNSNSGKPLFVFNEKGVEFDYHYISLTDFEQHAPDYLTINPDGTVPALVHRGRVFTESTPMCEYIDASFAGPSLVPNDAGARYRMRNRCRRTDKAAEALSVIGWHLFLGPMVRSKSPEEMERLIARIPTKERRISWQTASQATFSEEQLATARARVGEYVKELEADLAKSPWLAGDQFSLADILTFANFYALPGGYPEFATTSFAPRVLDWLRRIYARPATAKTFGMARSIARRAFDIARGLGNPMAEPARA
ncbi:MAG: glutathione S-transferase family protein [Steroidobacteraceae bacterium]